jgi:hypothetical protein
MTSTKKIIQPEFRNKKLNQRHRGTIIIWFQLCRWASRISPSVHPGSSSPYNQSSLLHDWEEEQNESTGKRNGNPTLMFVSTHFLSPREPLFLKSPSIKTKLYTWSFFLN